MPERPDLEYQVPILRRELVGLTVDAVRVRDPIVLRIAVEGSPEALLVNKRIAAVERRAHFVCFDLGELELVIHPMLAGRFSIDAADRRDRGDTTVGFGFSDGRELRYRDKVRMGKVYIIARGAHDQVPGLSTIGVDVLDPAAFTLDVLRGLLRKRRDQIKLFLKDKSKLDSLGNAYADEVLFASGIHPKIRCNKLTDEQIETLHTAIVSVLTRARETIEQRQPALDEKVRDFLVVRNRKGEPCVVCGTTIRAVGVRGFDAFYCPECQPDKGSGFVNWRR